MRLVPLVLLLGFLRILCKCCRRPSSRPFQRRSSFARCRSTCSSTDPSGRQRASSSRNGATEVGSAEVGVRQVRVGDRLEHRWKCENLARNQFLFVHDCVVNPEFDLQHDSVVLDSRGCPGNQRRCLSPARDSPHRCRRSHCEKKGPRGENRIAF
ncbi:hypothetical protein QR680_002793 [Steinernema hermaphroditum]|uniref:ZP domain-containing protein n=1 Tax=Steinernema hermaphroditum TaxID=289476 RepID=A0AA39H430_9BILA|nr:hypothetical protein QR680_002793 [Steinernema hermaphroditum]